MSVCKGCGQTITWAKFRSGKNAPFEPLEGGDWVLHRGGKPVKAEHFSAPMSETVEAHRATNNDPFSTTWECHYATCPMGGQFRKPKPAAQPS